MRIHLLYGEQGLDVELPETRGFQGVLKSRPMDVIVDPVSSLQEALDVPIGFPSLAGVIHSRISDSSKPKEQTKATILISDITRAVPNSLLLPPVLSTLEREGVRKENICILIGTGIHRPNEGEELIRLVGEGIASRYRIENHFSDRAEDLIDLGKTEAGIPIELNRRYVEADIKILTGFIEPHMWAGYSGGRKAVLPGIASVKTMSYMHGYEMIAHPLTRYGQLENNPFHEAALEVLRMAGADFVINVTQNERREVTGFWCGDPVRAHLEGCRFLSRYCEVTIDEPLDFVITTCTGAPLDLNFYQAIKGVSGVSQIVRPGGSMILAAACPEGIGSAPFTQLMSRMTSAEQMLSILRQPGFFVPDQWNAQELCQGMLGREVYFLSDTIDHAWLSKRGLHPLRSVEEGFERLLYKHGPEARWAAIPEGPLVVCRLRNQKNLSGESAQYSDRIR